MDIKQLNNDNLRKLPNECVIFSTDKYLMKKGQTSLGGQRGRNKFNWASFSNFCGNQAYRNSKYSSHKKKKKKKKKNK